MRDLQMKVGQRPECHDAMTAKPRGPAKALPSTENGYRNWAFRDLGTERQTSSCTGRKWTLLGAEAQIMHPGQATNYLHFRVLHTDTPALTGRNQELRGEQQTPCVGCAGRGRIQALIAQPATLAATAATYEGSLRLPRRGTGARKGNRFPPGRSQVPGGRSHGVVALEKVTVPLKLM